MDLKLSDLDEFIISSLGSESFYITMAPFMFAKEIKVTISSGDFFILWEFL